MIVHYKFDLENYKWYFVKPIGLFKNFLDKGEIMRIKENKYYDLHGKRRPVTRYLYLGADYKCAATWVYKGTKYIAVFDTHGECIQFQRDNAQSFIGMFISIEKKHVCRLKNGSHIMDYLTGLPAIDHYTGLPDDMYKTRVEKKKELGLNKNIRINNLKSKKTKLLSQKYLVDSEGERIAIGIEMDNIDREIKEIRKQEIVVNPWDLKPVKAPPYDINNIDEVDKRIAQLEKKDEDRTESDNEELARLIDVSNKYWDE